MAKRKRKTGTHRRRRSSRVGKVDFMQPLAMVAGAIVGNYAKNMLGGMLTFGGTTDPVTKVNTGGKNYSGVAVLLAGAFGKGMVKDPFMKGICDGLVVSGGMSTLHTFIPSLPINGINEIGGFNVIQGYGGRNRYIAGINEIGDLQEADGQFSRESNMRGY